MTHVWQLPTLCKFEGGCQFAKICFLQIEMSRHTQKTLVCQSLHLMYWVGGGVNLLKHIIDRNCMKFPGLQRNLVFQPYTPHMCGSGGCGQLIKMVFFLEIA